MKTSARGNKYPFRMDLGTRPVIAIEG